MATTTVAASSGGANAKGKLVGKDYITLAIFGVLLFLVFMVFAMVLGMNANLFWFTHACGSLIGGIVWMYVAAKVPKRGAFAIMSAIVAVVALLLGMLWTGPVGIVAGGLLAELVAGAGSKRTTLRCLAAFAVWTLCFWVGQVNSFEPIQPPTKGHTAVAASATSASGPWMKSTSPWPYSALMPESTTICT